MPGLRDDVAYHSLHKRVARALGSARLQKCVRCAEKGIDKQASDWARIHTESGEDPWTDYVPLCRPCHIFYDGINNGDPQIGQRRAVQQQAKDRCPAGHLYTPENTYVIQRAGGRTARQCKTCTKHPELRKKKGGG